MASSPRPIDPAKVAIYIRWSTEDQGEGTTLEVQRDGCTHYVRSQGWVVSQELTFVDDGYSGGSLDRPALTRLRHMVKAGQVDCVVVFKLDRLSRNVVDTVNLVLREWENRCYLKSARESIDTYDHAGKMFFYTLVSFAEWERSTIRDRTFSGRLRRAQEGRNPGRKLPYGYTTGEKRGEVRLVPGEAALVQRIFREYIAGASVRAIAFKLNGEGIPGPRRGGWAGPTIARMLANETYTGKLIFGAVTRMGKQRPEGTRAVVPNERPLVEKENALPVIISPEEFALAQAVKRERPSPGRGDGSGRALASAYLLSGLLVCGLCGGTMRARPPYDRNHALYYCVTRFHQGPSACDSSYIRQPDLDAEVVRHLKVRYGAAEHRMRHIQEYLAQVDYEVATVEAALRKVQELLRSLADEEAHVRKHFRQQAITLEEYRQMVTDLRGEEAELRGSAHTLSTRLSDLRATAGGQAYLVDTARRIDQWEVLDPAEQKNVLRFYVREVRAYKRPRSGVVACTIVWKSVHGVEPCQEEAP